MAAKKRKALSAQASHGREIMRPIISSDVMGNRNVEVVPVGAWVELAYDNSQQDAVMAAKMEEKKISQMKDEKENRLRSFQRQVKKRVNHANQIKRRQQIQEAEKAFELERKVVQESYEMGTSSRKDTCSLRRNDLEHAIKLRLLKKYGENVDEWENERQKISGEKEENSKVTSKARQQLVSRKISQTCQPSDVRNSSSQSKVMKVNRDIQSPIVKTVVEVDSLPVANTTDREDLEDSFENEKDTDEEKCDSSEDEDFDDEQDDDNSEDENEKKRTVQFSKPPAKKRPSRISTSASSKRPSSAKLAAMLYQFKESDVLERQRRQQASVSRRIFMDREREAVRESIRRQEHHKKIKSLKKEKEAYRQELESLAQKEVEVTYSVSEDENEDELQERLEAIHFEKMVERRKQELKRSREMERYLEALRHKLIEKARRLGLQLPALCACGDIWDTHPETCANNCFFYKNNRAYARTLQSLLASTEVM